MSEEHGRAKAEQRRRQPIVEAAICLVETTGGVPVYRLSLPNTFYFTDGYGRQDPRVQTHPFARQQYEVRGGSLALVGAIAATEDWQPVGDPSGPLAALYEQARCNLVQHCNKGAVATAPQPRRRFLQQGLCPEHQLQAVRITYGLPASFDNPRVLLGGCVIDVESPRFACPTCWSEPDPTDPWPRPSITGDEVTGQ